jgi:hypothetical protein
MFHLVLMMTLQYIPMSQKGGRNMSRWIEICWYIYIYTHTSFTDLNLQLVTSISRTRQRFLVMHLEQVWSRYKRPGRRFVGKCDHVGIFFTKGRCSVPWCSIHEKMLILVFFICLSRTYEYILLTKFVV